MKILKIVSCMFTMFPMEKWNTQKLARQVDIKMKTYELFTWKVKQPFKEIQEELTGRGQFPSLWLFLMITRNFIIIFLKYAFLYKKQRSMLSSPVLNTLGNTNIHFFKKFLNYDVIRFNTRGSTSNFSCQSIF